MQRRGLRLRRLVLRTSVLALVTLGAPGFSACGRSRRGNDGAVSSAAGRTGAAGLGNSTAGRAGRASGGRGGVSESGRGGSSGSGRVGGAGRGTGGAGAPDLFAGAAGAGQGGAPDEAGQSGGAGAGGTGAESCAVDAPPQGCGGVVVQSSSLTDFTRYMSNGRWGNTALGGVTGGTSLYHGPGGTDFTLEAVDGELHVSGLVPSHATSGFVLSFDQCVDASNYRLLEVEAGGELGNGELKLLLQTNTDYPIDLTNQRGACGIIDCETRLLECSSPAAPLPLEPTVFQFYFGYDSFTGGFPESTPGLLKDLVGLEIQVSCPSTTDCPVSFTLNSIALGNL